MTEQSTAKKKRYQPLFRFIFDDKEESVNSEKRLTKKKEIPRINRVWMMNFHHSIWAVQIGHDDESPK